MYYCTVSLTVQYCMRTKDPSIIYQNREIRMRECARRVASGVETYNRVKTPSLSV